MREVIVTHARGARRIGLIVILISSAAFLGCTCSSSHGVQELVDADPERQPGLDMAPPTPPPPMPPGPPECWPDDARAQVCPNVVCDGPPTWHWNGDRCFPIECGTCAGTDCNRGTTGHDQCEMAHQVCAPSLCRSTGGIWMWWSQECGHYACGLPPPQKCTVPTPGCNCGLSQRFDVERGCVAAPECPVFSGTEDALCRHTGGSWENTCCHSDCGETCPEPCSTPACTCGPHQRFTSDGCVEVAECFERRLRQSCDENTRCDPGLICCSGCGGGVCDPPVCAPPICDREGRIDECGNGATDP